MTTAVAYGCFTEATVLGAGAKSMSGPASVLFGVRKEMKRTKIRKGTPGVDQNQRCIVSVFWWRIFSYCEVSSIHWIPGDSRLVT